MANCKMCGASTTWSLLRYSVVDCKGGQRENVCKKCVEIIGADNVVTVDPFTNKLVIVDRSEADIRKKCNVCGKIFCYTMVDLDINEQRRKQARLNAISVIGGAMSGRTATAAVQQANMQNELDKIVDYNRCPDCGSLDLKSLTKEEFEQEMQNKNTPSTTSVISTADELKKFKELLDMGIITQEEFDAKKKELLGL